ncbi:hypothetical protein KUCAC02_025311, partial [Chaenocephalus aceratus]
GAAGLMETTVWSSSAVYWDTHTNWSQSVKDRNAALRQSGGQAERQELNRTEQPAIHMDQVDRLSINGLPLESKTPAQAREELLREIRIPAAIQVSLYVFAVTAPFPSPTHLQQERQKAFSE